MVNDGRTLTALAIAGLLGVAAVRGSRGIARRSTRKRPWKDTPELGDRVKWVRSSGSMQGSSLGQGTVTFLTADTLTMRKDDGTIVPGIPMEDVRVLMKLIRNPGSRGVVRASAGVRGKPSCRDLPSAKMLDLSTYHLRPADRDWLSKNVKGLAPGNDQMLGGPVGDGWIVWADEGLDEDYGISIEFVHILEHAVRCGASWIRFDEHTPTVKALPVFP